VPACTPKSAVDPSASAPAPNAIQLAAGGPLEWEVVAVEIELAGRAGTGGGEAGDALGRVS
jgi:hypothetical protein